MRNFAIFEVINDRATQVSFIMTQEEARKWYRELVNAPVKPRLQNSAESTLEIREV